MGLKSLTSRAETFPVPGGEITVRGLGLNDIVQLVNRHRDAMSSMFEVMQAAAAEQGLENTRAIAANLVETAPILAAEIIALSDGEFDDEAIKIAGNLPFPVQMEALERIGQLTFVTEGGPKKVLETVIRIASSATEALTSLRT